MLDLICLIMSKILNIGIIGFGNSAKFIAGPVINSVQTLRITKAYDAMGVDPSLTFDWVKGVGSVEEILGDSEIDIVLVCTPSGTHYDVAKKSIYAGKHTIVEKPITATEAEARELISLAKEKGVLLSVQHQRRWDSDFRTVKKIIESRVLGEIVEYEANWDRYRTTVDVSAWRTDGSPGSGPLMDLGSHLIDQALTLFGEPRGISAHFRYLIPGTVCEDDAEVMLHYPRHRVILRTSVHMKIPRPRFAVRGVNGVFIKHGLDPQEDAQRAGVKYGSPGWGIEDKSIYGTLELDLEGFRVKSVITSLPGVYAEYYKDIYKAITEEKAPAVRAEDGAGVVRVIELAVKSAATGGKIIDY